jgi:hypothetical protein
LYPRNVVSVRSDRVGATTNIKAEISNALNSYGAIGLRGSDRFVNNNMDFSRTVRSFGQFIALLHNLKILENLSAYLDTT